MTILYVWDADYPWDVRVEKICQSLATNGHTVHIMARNLARKGEYQQLGDLHVHRLRPIGGMRLNYALSFPAFFNPLWTRSIQQVIERHRVDLIIVRDLPLLIAGIRAGRRNRIPVVFDMAEDYVSMIRNVWRLGAVRPLNLVVRNPYLARLVERYAMPRVDHTLVVVAEAIAVVREAGGDVAQTTIVSNTPRLEELARVPTLDENAARKMTDRFTAVYIGGVRLERGLRTVLEAVERLIPDVPEILFIAVGNGRDLEQLRQMTYDRGLAQHVQWLGWKEHNEAMAYLRNAKVGLIPNFASSHTNTTIPNKIFDYMAFSVPVVASNTVPMCRLVADTKCGVAFQSGDAGDLARALLQVRRAEVDFGANGATAVRAKYNWHEDEKRLLDTIGRFGRAKKQPS